MIHAGKFKNTFFILDVESGALHRVDEIAYRIARHVENGLCDMDLIAQDLLALYSMEDILEAFTELDELQRQGLLFTPDLFADNPPQFHEPVIKSMCLNVAHVCNLRCSYCFASKGTYAGKAALMDEQTAKTALDFLVAQSQNRVNLEVDFFGGEPTLNFDVVQKAVAYGRQLEARTGKNIRFTLTTNAYAITDDMAGFINKEMKNLVVSIDGREEVHNRERIDAGGRGSWAQCVKNAKRLVAGRGEKEYYIRGTYTANNLDFSKDVLAIADMGFSNISIEPVINAGNLSLIKQDLSAIQTEYARLGDAIERRRKEGSPFSFFHFMVDFAGGPCVDKRLRGCGAAREYVAVTPEGDIYPCHQFVGNTAFKMGNVHDGSLDAGISAQFADCHVYAKTQCRNCWAKYFCSGGCAADAYKEHGNLMQPVEMSCEIEKARLDTAIGLYIREQEETA